MLYAKDCLSHCWIALMYVIEGLVLCLTAFLCVSGKCLQSFYHRYCMSWAKFCYPLNSIIVCSRKRSAILLTEVLYVPGEGLVPVLTALLYIPGEGLITCITALLYILGEGLVPILTALLYILGEVLVP